MSEEEILRYILCCVSYKHMFDLSPRITDSDRKKENLLFSSAVYFLRELCKNKNITVEDITYPVVALTNNDINLIRYRHCAEIEKPRRMSHKELSRWLREKPTREYKRSNRTDIGVNCFYSYIEEDADQEVDEFYLIREDDGEWREPLVEVES